MSGVSQASFSAAYTPATSNLTNISAVTSINVVAQVIGNDVEIYGQFVSPSTAAAGTQTSFDIDLPAFAQPLANFAQSYDAAGSGSAGNTGANPVRILARTGGKTVSILWASQTTSAITVAFSFKYRIA